MRDDGHPASSNYSITRVAQKINPRVILLKRVKKMVRLYGRTFATIREAARELGISTTPLVCAIKKGQLKVYGVAGTSYLIDLNEARTWKANNYSEKHAERVRKRWERYRKRRKRAKTKGQ